MAALTNQGQPFTLVFKRNGTYLINRNKRCYRVGCRNLRTHDQYHEFHTKCVYRYQSGERVPDKQFRNMKSTGTNLVGLIIITSRVPLFNNEWPGNSNLSRF